MKRSLSSLLAPAMALSLTACGGYSRHRCEESCRTMAQHLYPNHKF